jgi:Tol biopolymer transport system component
MSVRSSLRLSVALVTSALLSGCILFPPFFPPFGQSALTVENATDQDWVLSVTSDFPTTFAIPAGETGEVNLYAGSPQTVELLDVECAEVADLEWDDSFIGVRIGPDATLTGLEESTADGELSTFVEFFECGFGAFGAEPMSGAPLPDSGGTLLVAGADGSAWTLDAATAALEPITTSEAFSDGEHTLSPDGTGIAFARFSMSGSQGIFVAAADGTDERLLVEDGASPAWSPDGSRIAYLSTDPFAGASALSVVVVETGETIELAEGAMTLRWSPDGSRIAFISGDPMMAMDPFDMPPSELRTVDADGSGLETLAEATPFASAPAWSPDGTMIAFMAPGGGGGTDPFGAAPPVIQVHDLASGVTRTVAEVDDSAATDPAWSPDGSRLAFAVSGAEIFQTTGSIGVVSAAGGDVELLGTLEAYYLRPIWSPDGAWIATTRSVGMDPASTLVAVSVDGGGEVILATGVSFAAEWRSPR